MINFLCSLAIFSTLCSPNLGVLSILKPSQGGTGIGSATAGDVGKVIKVTDDDPFTYTLAADNDSGGAGSFSWTPTTYNGSGVNATSTGIWFKGSPLSVIASSTFFTYASTTQLDVTGTATSTFGGSIDLTSLGSHITAHGIRSDASDGLHVHANNWTEVANLGIGNTANATFYGGVNIDGTTRLATGLTGVLKASSGTVSVATAGTDYENALTFTYPLTRSTNTISLAFGTTTSNTWAGTQTFTNSPVFSSLTGGLVVSNAGDDTIFNVSTTTLAFSGPLTSNATIGNLVGGSNVTITYTGLATTSNLTQSNLLYSTGGAGVAGVATTSLTASTPLSLSQAISVLGASASALSIADAVADGATKGAASFTAADFNSSTGNISIDYTNGQAASASNKGFLTSADWTIFNNKIGSSSLSATFPISYNSSTGAITFGGLSTSTEAVQGNIPYFSGVNTFANVATSTRTYSGPFTTSGTLGAQVGGTNSVITWTGLATTSQPASSNLLVSNGGAGVYGVATNTVSCAGTVSCSSFTAIAGGAITITGSGGGAGNVSTSTNEVGGQLAYWTSNSATPALLGQVATSSLALSGPFTTSATLGNLVGGSNATINWTGLATTTAITQSHLLYSTGGAGVSSLATTSVTCSGTVSCTGFTAIGSGGAITITGAGASGSTAWATTSPYGTKVVQYPVDTTADILLGGSATSTADFWFDVDNAVAYIGQYATSDKSLSFASGTATTTIGYDVSNSAFSMSDSNTLGTNEWFTHLISGRNGYGTSTPWGIFSIASTTYDYTRPLFVVATSTDYTPFSIFGTTTNQRYNGATTSAAINGTRVAIGGHNIFGFLGGFVQLWINGWFDQRDSQQFCDAPVGATAIAADGVAGCSGFSFMEDGTGTLTASTTPAVQGVTFGALTTAAANDGAGVFLNGTSAGFLTLSTSTPQMDVYARIGNSQTASSTASGNTGYVIGFTNLATAGTSYETAPTAGCFFQATSTNNWQAVTRTASAATQTDTGVASTSVLTGSGAFRHFKIVADADACSYYIRQNENGNLFLVARHTTNLPTVALNAGVHMGRVNVGAMYATLDFYRLRVWWKSVLSN